MTMGMLLVALRAASTDCAAFVTITSTFACTSSAASPGNRSGLLSAKRNSKATLRPSVHPSSCKPCLNAASRRCHSGSFSASPCNIPMRRIRSPCCARAASGHVAAPPSSVVGAGEQRVRHVEAERPSGLEIDDQVILGGRLYRQVTRLLALEDAIDVGSGAAELIKRIGPVADQAAINDVITERIDRRQSEAGRKRDEAVARSARAAPGTNEPASARARKFRHATLDFIRITHSDRR